MSSLDHISCTLCHGNWYWIEETFLMHKGPPCTKDVQYKGGPSMCKGPPWSFTTTQKTLLFAEKVFGGTIEVVCRDSGTVQ